MSSVENARALLDLFRRSDWRELHVRVKGEEMFLARPGAGPNPMLGYAAPAAKAEMLRAPHIATLVSLTQSGTRVAAGDGVATLALLDEIIEIASPLDGAIGAAQARPGALLDYDAPIVEIVPA